MPYKKPIPRSYANVLSQRKVGQSQFKIPGVQAAQIPPTPSTSNLGWANLSSDERKKRWFYDKEEWFRQGGKTAEPRIPAAVSAMWNRMSEWKKDGVLDGSYDYTGKGLAQGRNY
jgi:hypothetical protein